MKNQIILFSVAVVLLVARRMTPWRASRLDS